MLRRAFVSLALLAGLHPWAGAQAPASAAPTAAPAACKPVYLVFDAGDMRSARLVGLVLRQAKVPATFFAGNSPTAEGGSALSRHWADWWRARGQDGHAFAVQPWDLALWRGDLPGREPRFRMRPLTGGLANREFTWDSGKYCAQLKDAAERIDYYGEKQPLPLFHAIDGKTSAKLLQAARSCGFAHVDWPASYFVGDGATPAVMQQRAQAVQPGSILLSHLNAWPGQDESAPAALAPLLAEMKAQGFCFKTLGEHPDFAAARK